MPGSSQVARRIIPICDTGAMAKRTRALGPALGAAVLVIATTGCAWIERSSVPTAPPPEWRALGNSGGPSISGSGRWVAFSSTDALDPGDQTSEADVYVRDNVAHTTELISALPTGTASGGASTSAGISDDGRYVGFTSNADGLVPGDADGLNDVFIRDRQTQTTTLVSVENDGTPISGAATAMDMSGDGHTVAICLPTPPPIPACSAIVIRRVTAGTTTQLPHLGGSPYGGLARLSSDGSRVAYGDFTLNGGPANVSITVADTATGQPLTPTYTAVLEFRGAGAVDLDLSGDGTAFAITESHDYYTQSPTGVVAIRKVDSVGTPIINYDGWTRSTELSRDGSVLVRNLRVGGTTLLVADGVEASPRIVGANALGDHPVTGETAFDLSADGKWIVFTSNDPEITDSANAGYSAVYTRSVAQSRDAPS